MEGASNRDQEVRSSTDAGSLSGLHLQTVSIQLLGPRVSLGRGPFVELCKSKTCRRGVRRPPELSRVVQVHSLLRVLRGYPRL